MQTQTWEQWNHTKTLKHRSPFTTATNFNNSLPHHWTKKKCNTLVTYPQRLLQSSVSVLLLHCTPAVGAHPQRQLQGTRRLVGLRRTVLARDPCLWRHSTVFTLTSAQETAIAGCVGRPLVQAEREWSLRWGCQQEEEERETYHKVQSHLASYRLLWKKNWISLHWYNEIWWVYSVNVFSKNRS